MTQASVAAFRVQKIQHNIPLEVDDLLAVYEHMEIRLGFGGNQDRQQRSLSVTMRTPGHDFELAVGFLFTEGIISSASDIRAVTYCEDVGKAEKNNLVRVELEPVVELDWARLQRNFYTTSSCGVCGKTAIEAIQQADCPIPDAMIDAVSVDIITDLPNRLAKQQSIFACTGGLHAAAGFDLKGKLKLLREDVGRHNALDKLIGACWYGGAANLRNSIVLLSGRIGFELVQKAVKAGIPVLAAVGAPSSLAVELAIQNNLTLLGFVRNGRFNIYAGGERIRK